MKRRLAQVDQNGIEGGAALEVVISRALKEAVPDFKIGVIQYDDITVGATPQFLLGRIAFFHEEWLATNGEKPIGDLPGVKEWRRAFKAVGTDPSRYRPSHEALIRRLLKERTIPSVNSAVDVNNYFSIKYEMPMGIYDREALTPPVVIKIGDETDAYEGLNGREMNMAAKLVSADQSQAFGSPIVDSRRSMVTEATRSALHILYLRPSFSEKEANRVTEEVAAAFTHVNGGTADWKVIR